MKRFSFFIFFLTLQYSINAKGVFTVFVANMSDFDIRCIPTVATGQGIFKQFAPVLKAHQKFSYVIMQNDSPFPKGVEGTMKFVLDDPRFPGYFEVYFDDPAVGSSSFNVNNSSFPFAYQAYYPAGDNVPGGILDGQVRAGTKDQIAVVQIYVDTTQKNHATSPVPLTTNTKANGGKSGGDPIRLDDALPPVVNFEWRVTQRMRRDDDDDDNKGKAYKEVTYYFTTDGEYAATKADDASFSLMVYAKNGQTWIINDDKKRIIVLSMPKTVGEGGMFGKAVAESIAKQPLKKDNDDEGMPPLVKSGKTRTILGYTADEYLMTPKQNSTENMKTSASFWFAKVPFDPVKISTMGVGRPADVSTIANNPKFKDSYFAIPILNKNYLQIEAEAGGLKGMETTEIAHSFHTIYTAGYKVKVAHNMIEAMKAERED